MDWQIGEKEYREYRVVETQQSIYHYKWWLTTRTHDRHRHRRRHEILLGWVKKRPRAAFILNLSRDAMQSLHAGVTLSFW